MYVKTFLFRGGCYKNRGRFWRVSDCEELVGDNYTGEDGVDGGDFTWRVVNMNLLLKNGQTIRQC